MWDRDSQCGSEPHSRMWGPLVLRHHTSPPLCSRVTLPGVSDLLPALSSLAWLLLASSLLVGSLVPASLSSGALLQSLLLRCVLGCCVTAPLRSFDEPEGV
eukprot:1806530-Rhodomonas_salina.1